MEGVEGCPTSNFDPESIENIKLDFSQFQKYIFKLVNNRLHLSSSNLTLIEKLTVNRVIKPSIVLIDKAFKGRLVVPDFDSFKNDISNIFSRSTTWQTQKKQIAEGASLKGEELRWNQNLDCWGAAICTTDGQRFSSSYVHVSERFLSLWAVRNMSHFCVMIRIDWCWLGICYARFSLGDSDSPFVVDSVSKPFTYALCIDRLGAEVPQSCFCSAWILSATWIF